MSEPSAPVSKSPFWQFSVKFYAVPGVAEACIALQDQAKVDVNILFFLLWNATQGRAFNAADVDRDRTHDRPLARHGGGADPQRPPRVEIAAAGDGAGGGRRPPHPDQGGRAGGRTAPAGGAVRPRADRAASASRPPRPRPRRRATASAAYQGVIGPFPPGPLDTVLSAFAKFDTAPDSGSGHRRKMNGIDE